ncbi:NAD(+) synthase [Mycoplasmopsis gallopavonis]|uniref:NH(3)-dependent NAD(+) synthetase n=1 Tax=Mycoplasmopsis gallopavonis TaxID=76629 RepID=A0A449AZQ6_9BACT|nr:NAD(+) synthase [Mycoplasmopsis gallopavonis]RIV16892.1 NAD(+) synthase [Mycoplasmopsis gallopavonis]VEU73029.1 NAD+ synthetase [Mycoplasmopsis gallopavonis]
MSKITKYINNQVVYDEQKAYQYLTVIQKFLKDKVKEAKADGVVVGISSGIDSSLVYAIAKSVFPNSTTGVVMPVISMTDTDLSHIKELETSFNDQFLRVDLTETFNAITNSLQVKNHLAIANIKPRLRMTTLYAIAQERNSLVLGTDNADEVFIGYFTKFGDGGADLLPICNLTKGEVKFLASLLNVPNSILNKKPSAGLWEGQTDEDELGFSYSDLDFYLNHIDQREVLDQKLSQDTIAKIEHKHKITQHKRDAIYKPDIVK